MTFDMDSATVEHYHALYLNPTVQREDDSGERRPMTESEMRLYAAGFVSALQMLPWTVDAMRWRAQQKHPECDVAEVLIKTAEHGEQSMTWDEFETWLRGDG